MVNTDNSSAESTFENFYQDSFDKIVGKRSALQKLNLIKKDAIRASFNMDSSVENSYEIWLKDRGRPKKAGSISTPLSNKNSKRPFKCGISPIASWHLTNFPPANESSESSISQGFNKANIYSTKRNKISDPHKVKARKKFQKVIEESSILEDEEPEINYNAIKNIINNLRKSKNRKAFEKKIPVKESFESKLSGSQITTGDNNIIDFSKRKTRKTLRNVIVLEEESNALSISEAKEPEHTSNTMKNVISIKNPSNERLSHGESKADSTICDLINGFRKHKSTDKLRRISNKRHKSEINPLPLSQGKWRKSLIIWRRNQRSLVPNARIGQRRSIFIKKEEVPIAAKERESKNIVYTENDIASVEQCKDLIFKICKQNMALSFFKTYSKKCMTNCKKIGEGAFGEVFLNKCIDKGDTVLKIIPIEGAIHVNGEPQKTFKEVLPEIIITTEMSSLRKSDTFMTSSFVELKKVTCVRGKYPEHLKKEWNIFDEKHTSENDNPSIFKSDQLYIILELSYGGTDLETFVFKNAEQSYYAFLQLTLALAVAEKSYQFEHRDLHWGNILITPTDQDNIDFIFDSNSYQIPTKGVKVTIIDYTLSRMLYENCILFNDLSQDEELFNADGDQQFEIYRQMRKLLKDNWNTHMPKTNILWLSYVIGKMINGVKYSSKRSAKHYQYLEKCENVITKIMDVDSAHQLAMLLLN